MAYALIEVRTMEIMYTIGKNGLVMGY